MHFNEIEQRHPDQGEQDPLARFQDEFNEVSKRQITAKVLGR